MSANQFAQDDSSGFKAAASLTTAYASGWATGAIRVKGLQWLALKLDLVQSAATTLEVKMENSPDGSTNWRDCYKDTSGTGALDETSVSVSGSISPTFVFYVGPYNWVRFAAKGTSASGDTLAADYSAV